MGAGDRLKRILGRMFKPTMPNPGVAAGSDTSAIAGLRDRHVGQRAFIVANGPSMRAEYFDLLKGELCFGFNNVYKVFPRTAWRPTYWMVHDPVIGAEIADDMPRMLDEGPRVLAGIDLSLSLGDDPRITYYRIRRPSPEADGPEFATELERGLFAGCTVVYAALQFAWYMGVREVYLLGVDLAYSIETRTHVREHGKHAVITGDFKGSYFDPELDPGDRPRIMPDTECMRAAMEKAGEFFTAGGGVIRNAAPDSPFHLFEQRSIREIIAG